MRRIFLDLDGVMADLEGAYYSLFQHRMDDAPSKKAMWDSIYSVDDFFYKLPLMDGAKQFYRKLKEYSPVILTSCPRSRYGEVADQKIRWVKDNLDKKVLVIPVNGSEAKKFFAQNKGDILIDDYGKNCREWKQAGGTAIQHRGTDFASTLRRVSAAL